jgi:hypothetical protein
MMPLTPYAGPQHQLREFLYRYDPAVQSLALGLRKVVHEEMAPCHERILSMRHTVSMVYSGTAKVIKDGICIITVHKKHVNLLFFRGSELSASANMLIGTGKRMRHITLKKLSELDRPEIRACLREARRVAGLKRPPRGTARDVVTTVKANAPAPLPFGRRMPRRSPDA